MIYQGDVLTYIYETPEILAHIVKNEESILKDSRELLKGQQITEIYLTGSGSSYNAAVAATAFAKKLLGIRVVPVYPVAFMEDIETVSKEAVLLGISQQGTSMAVIQALDEAKKAGIHTISVTGEYDTEITRYGDANIYVECGYEDAGATTKGYTATVLTLILFVLMFAEDAGKADCEEVRQYKDRIMRVVDNMEHVLSDSRNWCEKVAEHLKNSTDLIIITGNHLQSVLLEGVLKFSETCRFPVRGYSAEEFMHGMYNAVRKDTDFLYLFSKEGYEVERMERLFEYYEKQGYKQYTINRKTKENGITSACFVNDSDFSVLEYMLPQQMLFVLTSRAREIDLNTPKDPDFHKYMKSKLE